MAGSLTDEQLAQHVYGSLQVASCPLVQGLYLPEADILPLLCSPSELRINVLAWICSSINPNFANHKATVMSSKDPDLLTKEITAFGQELMLCKGDDLELIRGNASPHRQLRFLEQLLTLVPHFKKSAGLPDGEALLNELFAAESLPHLTQMLKPTLDPWPVNIKALRKSTKSSSKPREAVSDVAALLQSTQSELEQLKSKCDFLVNEEKSLPVFSPSSLRLVACDLQQLMTTFCHVYETDLRAYCTRDPPRFSTEIDVFQRVHELLLACNTELEMLKEVSEASESMNEEVKQLQTQPRYWSRGEKHTLPDQLQDLTKRIEDFLWQLHS
ncbi:HAUS augmin-like complex subunit 7 [Melanotaenia boesemani]|uniref:HAUS augmin-like complex subunit 7 n=1 Tax=Melanotaenia boesemani TaxID=1250792 RepID=UPI001C048739|nr:HAUS augmin-like complex subunit 7 [Melanotaenia boesemani]